MRKEKYRICFEKTETKNIIVIAFSEKEAIIKAKEKLNRNWQDNPCVEIIESMKLKDLKNK